MKQIDIDGLAGAVVVLIAASTASANPLELLAPYTYGYSFSSGTCWEGGVAPQPGYDFRVANERQLQVGYGTTGSDQVFNFTGDSLILGEVGGSGGIFCHGGAADITVSNFVLANGRYWAYYSWGYSATSKLRGSATVKSPASAPFRIDVASASEKHLGVDWHMVTSGEVGTGFVVTGGDGAVAGRLNIRSSNPSFQGSVRAEGSSITLGIAHSDSLGGTLAEFNEKALVLAGGATLASLNGGIALEAAANRGIYVESTGGRIGTPEGCDMTVGWPISGAGTLSKVGAGTLYLSNAVSAAAMTLVEGSLTAAPGTVAAVSSLAIAGGCLAAGAGCGVLSIQSLSVGEGCRIPVKILGESAAGTSFPFMTASAGKFTAGDFQIAADGAAAYGGPFAKVTSVLNGDSETFSLTILPVVTTAGDGNSGLYAASVGAHWSDGRPVHEDAAYVVAAETSAKTFRVADTDVFDESERDYLFPGHSLTLAGASDGCRGRMVLRSKTFEGNLRFRDWSRLSFGDVPEPLEYLIRGSIDIKSSDASRESVNFPLRIAATTVVESVVSGSGWLYLSNPGAAGTVGTIVFSATNTYSGGVFAWGGSKHVCLRISDERNLGVNPPSFVENALSLEGGAIFHPVGSVTIDDANRGVRLAENVRIRVDEDETLSFCSPVTTYSVNFTKEGGGTLQFGGSLESVHGDLAAAVNDGFIKGGAARTFASARFTFADGAGLAVDRVTDLSDERATYGTVLTNSAVSFQPGTLKIRIDHDGRLPSNGETVPALTVPSSVAASLGDRVEFVKNMEIGKWVLVRDDVTFEGLPCVRYSARCEKGLAVIIH